MEFRELEYVFDVAILRGIMVVVLKIYHPPTRDNTAEKGDGLISDLMGGQHGRSMR